MGVAEFSLLIPYFLVAHALIRGRSIFDFLPSLSWLVLVVIPFLYSKEFFSSTSIDAQFLGIMLFSLALILGDKLSPIPIPFWNSFIQDSNNKTSTIFTSDKLLLLLVIFVPVSIYFLDPQIPLFKLLTEGEYSLEIARLRAQYTKSGMPLYILSILGNYILNLVGPFLILRFYAKKRRIISILIFFWVSFYALSSAAKFPFLTFLLIILICLILQSRSSWELPAKILILSGSLLFAVSMITFANQITSRFVDCKLPIQVVDTPASQLRYCSTDTTVIIKVMDTLTYRVFLTPIEVSNHWYQEFTNSDEVRKFDEIFGIKSKKNAANTIGLKYYYLVYGPEKYLPSVSAYASIDADSYSFGGHHFVFIAALIMFMIRVFIHRIGIAAKKPYLIAFSICFFSLFPALASIQAILFSQGLAILILFAFFYLFKINKDHFSELA